LPVNKTATKQCFVKEGKEASRKGGEWVRRLKKYKICKIEGREV
jgi:hypothetical protein